MVMRNVPMYRASIPIRGGGGVSRVDTSERPQPNPIVVALQQMIQQKRLQEQDELNRRITEAELAHSGAQTEALGRPKEREGILIMVDDKTLLIDPVTGETITEVPMPPESARKILEHINPMTGRPRRIFSRQGKVMGTRGADGELIPSPITEALEEPTAGRKRKKVESKAVTKEPRTVEEFEAETARLKATGDMKKARAYYDKWVSKWQ